MRFVGFLVCLTCALGLFVKRLFFPKCSLLQTHDNMNIIESTRRKLYGIYIPEPQNFFKYIANEVIWSNWVVNWGVNSPNEQIFVQLSDGWAYYGTGLGFKNNEVDVYTGWGTTMFSFSGDQSDNEYGVSLIVGNYGVRVDQDLDDFQTAVEVIAGSTEIGILADFQDEEYGFRLRYRDFEFSIRHDFNDVGDPTVGDNVELATELYVGYKSFGIAIGADLNEQTFGIQVAYKGRDMTFVQDLDDRTTDVSVNFGNGWSMVMLGDFADPMSDEVYGRFGIGTSKLFVSVGAGVSRVGMPQGSFSVVAKSWNIALDAIDDVGTDMWWFSIGVGRFSYVWESTVDWNYAIVDLPSYSNVDTNFIDESQVPLYKASTTATTTTSITGKKKTRLRRLNKADGYSSSPSTSANSDEHHYSNHGDNGRIGNFKSAASEDNRKGRKLKNLNMRKGVRLRNRKAIPTSNSSILHIQEELEDSMKKNISSISNNAYISTSFKSKNGTADVSSLCLFCQQAMLQNRNNVKSNTIIDKNKLNVRGLTDQSHNNYINSSKNLNTSEDRRREINLNETSIITRSAKVQAMIDNFKLNSAIIEQENKNNINRNQHANAFQSKSNTNDTNINITNTISNIKYNDNEDNHGKQQERHTFSCNGSKLYPLLNSANADHPGCTDWGRTSISKATLAGRESARRLASTTGMHGGRRRL